MKKIHCIVGTTKFGYPVSHYITLTVSMEKWNGFTTWNHIANVWRIGGICQVCCFVLALVWWRLDYHLQPESCDNLPVTQL